MDIELLKKKSGGRFKDVRTIKITENCQNNKLKGIQTLKDSNEGGVDPNNFVHVIKSVLKEYNKPVIVKILDATSIFVKKELNIIQRLQDYEYSVQMICNFSCMDDKSRWNENYSGNVDFCNKKNDNLHFIVYEYIEDGDISEYLSIATKKEVACIFFQLSMAIIILAYKYNITHGDLHTGNILMYKTDKSKVKYTYDNDSFYIQTNGFIPIFIDYGMSKIMKPVPENIMDDIFIAIQNCIPYINKKYRNVFQTFLNDQFTKNSDSPYNYILDMKKIIQLSK
jgi:serine/threonine protein kinase